MCRFAARARADTVTPVFVKDEPMPAGPSIDAQSIRQRLSSMARDKGDANKVLAAHLNSTSNNSYEYNRAQSRTSQEGVIRRFSDGRLSTDYQLSADGRPRFDFSETQDVVTHTERSVHTTRGPLGRVRQNVVEHHVQTLVSEKVRLDFNLSEKLDIKVGQNDTVFINGALQTGNKDINLTQRDGQGSLAIVLGRDQTLKDVTFDRDFKVATVTTDQGVLTIRGVSHPSSLVIGRESGMDSAPSFVSIDALASDLRRGRLEVAEENKKSRQATVERVYGLTKSLATEASSAMKSYAEALRAKAVAPPSSKPSYGAHTVEPPAPAVTPHRGTTTSSAPTTTQPKQTQSQPSSELLKRSIEETLSRVSAMESKIASLNTSFDNTLKQHEATLTRLTRALSTAEQLENRIAKLNKRIAEDQERIEKLEKRIGEGLKLSKSINKGDTSRYLP